MERERLVGWGEAAGNEAPRGGDVDGEELEVVMVMTAPVAVEAVVTATSCTELADKDWSKAPVASSSKPPAKLASSGSSSSATPGDAGGLAVVGVLGLLLAVLLRRMRSTSDGRALNVGRKPSIQDEFKPFGTIG